VVQSQQDAIQRREISSFRDPAGQIVIRNGVAFREINPSGMADYNLFITSGLYEALLDKKLIIPHQEIHDGPALCLLPKQLDFISYPYEWPFSYYKKAALATIEIAEEALKHGMMLKDASAFNMQYIDGQMQLIDTLSFSKYEPGMPWFSFQQFLQHFLNPMLLMTNCGPALSGLHGINGIPSKLTAQLLPWYQHLSFDALAYVYAPSWGKDSATKKIPRIGKLQLTAFLHSLKNYVISITYKVKSAWSEYDNCSYSVSALADKHHAVSQMLLHLPFGKVLDLGANTGYYSMMAALGGNDVIATDNDHDCVEYIVNLRPNVLALRMDVCNPTPAVGWDNAERKTFWDRCHPDTILCLALIHHLCISNNTPLDYVAKLFSAHCQRHLIIEWVPPDDPKAAAIAFNRIFPRYNLDVFKSAFSDYFTFEQERPLADSKRIIYLMEKR